MHQSMFRILGLGALCLACHLDRAVEPGGPGAQTVIALDLTQCPDGTVLEFAQVPEKNRRFGPPNPEVDKHFTGWMPGLSGWKGVTSCMKVERENGVPVLVGSPPPGMPGRSLVCGHSTWTDLDIEATVRLLRQNLIPDGEAYGEHTAVPQVGIFARSADTIRFYMLALEPDRVSLYLKDQEEWIPLARRSMAVKPDTWYTLRFSVVGTSLRGYVDGQLAGEANDATYATGKAGLRFNAECRVRDVKVLMTAAQSARADTAKAADAAAEAAARARYPKPVVLKTLNLPGSLVYPAHLRTPETWDLVVVGDGKTCGVTLEGKVLWEYAGQLNNVAPGGPDAGGVSRVVGATAQKLVMLDGRNGAVLHEAPALPQMIYNCWRLGNLTGKGEVNYVARSGDNTATFTVYDENLAALFAGRSTIQIGHTHGVGFWDVDADGTGELLAGGSCFRGDGRHLWDSRVTEAHLDQVAFGPLGPLAEPTAVFLGVDEGVTFVDGRSGERLSCVPNGHPQGVIAGDFRPDIPGLEVLTISRWASYGVTGLFTGRGQILKQWMLAGEELPSYSLPVTWGDDGGDLILVSLLFRPPTLYDGYGHEIRQLPEAPGYRLLMTLLPLDITGDGRDEILSVNGKTLTVYTQDTPAPPAAPKRASTVKWMNMSLPAWAFLHGENLVGNGGFEEVGADGKPKAWRLQGDAALVAGQARVGSGAHAVRVNFENSAWTDFPVKPETVYVVTGLVRHDLPAAVDPGRLKILFKSQDGAVVGASAARLFNLNANVYRGFDHRFRTPAGAATCSLGLCGRFTGSDYMLYDDVAVREVVAAPRR